MARGKDYARPVTPGDRRDGRAGGDDRGRKGSSRAGATSHHRKGTPVVRAVRHAVTLLPAWAWTVLTVGVVMLAVSFYTVTRPAVPLRFSPSSEEAKQIGDGTRLKPKGKEVKIPPAEASTYDFYSMLPNEQVNSGRPRRGSRDATGRTAPPVPAATDAAGREARPPPLPAQPTGGATPSLDDVAGDVQAPAPSPSPVRSAPAAPAVRAPLATIAADASGAVEEARARRRAAAAVATAASRREPPAVEASVRPSLRLESRLSLDPATATPRSARTAEPRAASPLPVSPRAAAPAAPREQPDDGRVSASGGRYLIQIASYRTGEEADERRAALALDGFAARVESAQVNGATWHRVRLGPFANRGAAEAVRARLAATGSSGGVLLPVRR